MVHTVRSLCMLMTLAGGLLFLSTPAHSQNADDGFVPLFDGKSLDGWEGNLDYFRVEKGAIVAGSLEKKIPHNEFLATQRTYSDFELRLDVKLVGEGENAGVQFRSKRIQDSSEVEGYQADAGMAWDRPVWGAIYDESRRRKMLAEGPKEKVVQWVKQGDWNELRIVACGPCIRVFLNGNPTVNYTEPDKEIAADGIIALQIHSGPPTEAWYRNIRIREIGQTETLMRQKISKLESFVDARYQMFSAGQGDYRDLLQARQMLLDAKMSVANSVQAKLELLSEKVAAQEEMLEHLQVSASVRYEVVLLAEIELLDLKIQQSKMKHQKAADGK